MNLLLAVAQRIDAFTRQLGKTLWWLILAATLISALNAIVRKLFSVSSNAFLEIQWYLFAATYLLGLGYAFLENAHVRIDIIAHRFSPRTRAWIDLFGILLIIFPLSLFLIRFSWPVVIQAFRSGEVSSNAGGLLRWPLYALVPAGYALLLLQSIAELIKRIALLRGIDSALPYRSEAT
ncbi:MAG: TRAP transporter small permease subunit [Hydrogenophilus sp.]|nr:TRAP transporter small permease subunit [Hydrogenophilus sp.]